MFLFLGGLFVSGCLEYAAGVGTGVTAMQTMADNAQKEFIVSINQLNEEKAQIDTLIDKIENVEIRQALEVLIDEQTVESIEQLGETAWKDPKVISGYLLALGGIVTAAYQKKMRSNGA